MLVFEPIYTDGLAQISYLVGDSKAAVAAVIDPRRDVDVYLDLAREKGLRIAYAIETHIHADFVSGAQALAERSGAEIIGGCSPDYGFELRQAADGEVLELGQVSLEIIYSPGHTPEHISLLLRDGQQGDEPFALFTGDTLFNLDVGAPTCSAKTAPNSWPHSSMPPSSPAICRSVSASRSIPATARVRPAANPSVIADAPRSATSCCSTRRSTSGAAKANSSTGC